MQKKFNAEAYLEAKKDYEQMEAFCDANGIKSFDDLFVYCSKNNAKWLKRLTSTGGIRRMSSYFKRIQILDKHKEAMAGETGRNTKARVVICTDNGMVFSSINKAAEWAGIKHTQEISDCCRGVIRSVRGYHFKFKEDCKNDGETD